MPTDSFVFSLPDTSIQGSLAGYLMLTRDYHVSLCPRILVTLTLTVYLLAPDAGGDDLIVTGDRWRQLQVGNRPWDFTHTSESNFYLLPRVWTSMTPLFEQWVGLIPSYANVLKSTLLRYLPGFVGNNVKLKETRFQLGYLIPLTPLPEPLQPLPLTYEPVPCRDSRFHWFLFFYKPGNIRILE